MIAEPAVIAEPTTAIQTPPAEKLSVQDEPAPLVPAAPDSATAAADRPEPVLCPKCGAPMIRRKAAKGANAGKEFFGCSNYPHCHGIISIEA